MSGWDRDIFRNCALYSAYIAYLTTYCHEADAPLEEHRIFLRIIHSGFNPRFHGIGGNRTHDLIHYDQTLYQLSHPVCYLICSFEPFYGVTA